MKWVLMAYNMCIMNGQCTHNRQLLNMLTISVETQLSEKIFHMWLFDAWAHIIFNIL